MKGIYEQIAAYIDAHQEEMVQVLRNLVLLEGHYSEKENVEKAMDYYCDLLIKEGFTLEKHPVAANRAGVIVADLGKDRQKKPVLLSGHFDTVFMSGSWGEEPFREEDGKVYGPGVIDMKGGDVMALYVVKALNHIGFNERPIRLILVGDEEADHVGSNGDVEVIEGSRGCLCAFNMEFGDMQNRLVIGRKTQHTFHVKVHGVGGHAGNDVLTGRNAVLEAAWKMVEIAKLANMEIGTTITPSVVRGGENSSSIPDVCEFSVDTRLPSTEEIERVYKGIQNIVEHSYIEGTSAEYTVDVAKFQPYSETEGISRLFELVNSTALEVGMEPFGKVHRGGVADSGNIAAAGVPVLDGCGLVGEFAHNKKEYGILDVMYNRTKLLAYVITKLGTFEA